MPVDFIRRLAIPSNISTYISRTLIIITVAATLLIGGMLIVSQSIHWNNIIKEKSEEYTENQKIYIREIVQNELEYIRIQNDQFKQGIHDRIRQNVNQAISTAESIYQKYSGKKSEEEIKSLIIATISSLKFEMEYEEVFISDLNGIGVYYPRRPDFTGKNLASLKDANDKPVVHEELKLLNSQNEGFLDYDLSSDSENPKNSPQRKIAFVRKFNHFNWYFGAKQYIDDYFPKFRDEIAQKISTVRFRYGGYVFFNQTDGTPLVMDGKIYKGTLNLLTNTDDKRHKIFRKELEVIEHNHEGGYFYYQWNKMNETVPSEKCSYVTIFKEYNWLIGAGFYLDEINQSIEAQQRVMKQDQKRSILIILGILIILLFIEAYIIYHFNKRYNADFDRFFNFFFQSQNSFNKLNVSELYFDEFKRAGVAANKMIMLREEIEHKLIEEQKKATEADRLKSAFLANMSHEIRTPMNAIIGFAELLGDETHDADDRKIFVKMIQKNGETLLNLINDIIDISKIEANLLVVRRRPLKLKRFLEEVRTNYNDVILLKSEKNLQFYLTHSIDHDLTVLTDEMRLRQILDNLIGNAIKFTSEGTVSVAAKIEGNYLNFNISDTGIGIPLEQQASIFERFMQADLGQKTNFGGTGLGLAISRNLIELLGGSIQVKSEPGKGSTFYFNVRIN